MGNEVEMKTTLFTKVAKEFEALPEEQKRRVLEFMQSLRTQRSKGVTGTELLRFAGSIPLVDLETMEQTIQPGG
jgi:hypothetical protein